MEVVFSVPVALDFIVWKSFAEFERSWVGKVIWRREFCLMEKKKKKGIKNKNFKYYQWLDNHPWGNIALNDSSKDTKLQFGCLGIPPVLDLPMLQKDKLCGTSDTPCSLLSRTNTRAFFTSTALICALKTSYLELKWQILLFLQCFLPSPFQ